MARDYKAYGDSFLKGVLAKVGNAEKRAQIEALLADADVAPIIPEIGQGVFMQSDYSRAMNETDQKLKDETDKLRAHEQQLNDWWAENEPLVKDGLEWRKAKGELGDKTPSGDKGLTKEQIAEMTQKAIDERELAAAGYINTVTRLGLKHMAEFPGEVLDPNALVQHARTKKLTLEDAYTDLFREKYDAKAKHAEDEKVAKLRSEIEAEVVKKYTSQPYPIRGTQSDTSPLASLETGGNAKGVDEAVAAYEQLAAVR